jgi:signal transduction histidine kinase
MDTQLSLVSLLRRTFWISSVAIAAIALTVIGVAMVQRATDQTSQASRELVATARRAELLALDRETGVRGYLLTGDSSSLEPDITARTQLRALLDSLVQLSAANPDQQRRAQAFVNAINRWDSTFATPAIAQRAKLRAGEELTAFGAGGLAGKLLFDDVRTRYAEFDADEERLYRERTARAKWLQTVNVAVAISGLVALGLILAMLRTRTAAQAEAIIERQTQLEEQATELEEQASELEEQATELESQTEELQDTVKELARKNDELNAFSSSVAHDLRSPLRSIDGFSHLLLSDYAHRLDDDGRNALTRIRTNAQRMGELIDGLLTLARVSGGELRKNTINFTEIAEAAGDDLLRGLPADRSIDYIVHRNLDARGDTRLLRVAIQNLVDNAFKFTRQRSDARVEVGSTAIDGQPVFFVSDNGVGFDMRYANKLFGAFERLHDDPTYEGTGIGLATVRRIIERHGGKLWAESEPGRGATFYFTVAP